MANVIGYALDGFASLMRRTYTPNEDDPWWADNLAHGLSGGAIGGTAHLVLGFDYLLASIAFLLLAAIWEAYEYAYGIRPWDEREDWSADRAIEDTMLDTYVGLTGALVAVFLL